MSPMQRLLDDYATLRSRETEYVAPIRDKIAMDAANAHDKLVVACKTAANEFGRAHPGSRFAALNDIMIEAIAAAESHAKTGE